jgi:acyl carrier protein
MNEKTEIREFIHKLLLGYGDEAPFGDDETLLDDGRLQSIDAVEIVMFLETKFGVDFSKIGFDRDQLDGVDAIHALVQTSTNSKG